MKGDNIPELSPEQIKENLKQFLFETRAEVLTTDQIINTARELRDLIQSKDEILRQISDLTLFLEEIMKEEKLKKSLMYKNLFEIGISLVDQTNVCPLCGRQWETGDFMEYLEIRQQEVKVAEEKQAKIALL